MEHVEWYQARLYFCEFASDNVFCNLLFVARRSTHFDAIWLTKHFPCNIPLKAVSERLLHIRKTDPIASSWLEALYFLGVVIEEKMLFLRASADSGHVFSCVLYSYYDAADKYYYAKKAADLGDPEGCMRIAMLYAREIKNTNANNARFYFKKAMRFGYRSSTRSVSSRIIKDIFPSNQSLYWIGYILSQYKEHIAVGEEVEAYKTYTQTTNACRKAVLTWILVSKVLKVNKDIAPIIAKLVWNSRSEAEYTFPNY